MKRIVMKSKSRIIASRRKAKAHKAEVKDTQPPPKKASRRKIAHKKR